jgi:phage replication initiation protein
MTEYVTVIQESREDSNVNEETRSTSGSAGGRVGSGNAPRAEPPASNTGARNTSPPPETDRVSLDWLEFTLPIGFHLPHIGEMLGLDAEWVQAPRGMNGYRKQYVAGGVRILTNGTPEMGHHVVISGSAFVSCSEKVETILAHCLHLGNVTRLDIAYDSVSGLLDMDRVRQHIKGGSLLTPFRRGREIQELDLSGEIPDSDLGRTIYIGSGKSRILFRVYDKGLETGSTAGGKWIRLECQLRSTHAHNAAIEILVDGAGGVLRSICAKYLSFRQGSADSNKSRWSVAGWWSAFLESAGRIKLAIDKVKKTLIEKRVWFERQLGPTFAAICQAFGTDEITKIYTEGARRMSKELRESVILAKI